jgi:SAM-dependent methyltransferase
MANDSQAASAHETPADIETSSEGYAARFKGPTGAWMLGIQERVTLDLLKSAGISSVLEVGGGHGQLTAPLVHAGYKVTVHGSDAICQRGVADLVAAGRCQFTVGSFLQLPFPDRSFDAVVSVRLIMHSSEWPRVISELCRVARRTVVVDYPTVTGLNALSPLLFGAKKRLEKNTRTWRNFSHLEVEQVFAAAGFKPAERRGQFFFPMVIHRTLRMRAVSSVLEGSTGLLGLNRRWGSPVLARFDRGAA